MKNFFIIVGLPFRAIVASIAICAIVLGFCTVSVFNPSANDDRFFDRMLDYWIKFAVGTDV